MALIKHQIVAERKILTSERLKSLVNARAEGTIDKASNKREPL